MSQRASHILKVGVLALIIGVVGWFLYQRTVNGQLGGMSANKSYCTANQAAIAEVFSDLSLDPSYTGGLSIHGATPSTRAQVLERLAAFFREHPLPDHPWCRETGLSLTIECSDQPLFGRYQVQDGKLTPLDGATPAPIGSSAETGG